MRQCANCEQIVPWTIVIDGKRRNLANRKLCLNCSAWGSTNSKGFACRKKVQHKIKCKLCSKPTRGGRRRCDACNTKLRRHVQKLKALNYLGGNCSACGFTGSLAALDFHHRDPVEKKFQISRYVATMPWNDLKTELDKCSILCRNCHASHHENKGELFLKEAAKIII